MSPPGVVASSDGAMVSSPVSLVEWFLNFYDASKAARHVECICREGAPAAAAGCVAARVTYIAASARLPSPYSLVLTRVGRIDAQGR